jgi:hypothetical protein
VKTTFKTFKLFKPFKTFGTIGTLEQLEPINFRKAELLASLRKVRSSLVASIALRNPGLEAQTAGQIIEYRGNYDAVPSEWCQLAVLQEADKTFYGNQSYDKGNNKSNTEL